MGFGGDIDPARYGGDAAHPTLTNVSARRDAFEFGLVEAALAVGQAGAGDLPRDAGHQRRARRLDARRRGRASRRRLGPLGARARVGAHRQRAPRPPGPRAARRAGLAAGRRARAGPAPRELVAPPGDRPARRGRRRATGRAEDGVVEAIEVAGDAWVLGVQWELQESWKEDERQAASSARSSARQLVQQRAQQPHEAAGRGDVAGARLPGRYRAQAFLDLRPRRENRACRFPAASPRGWHRDVGRRRRRGPPTAPGLGAPRG